MAGGGGARPVGRPGPWGPSTGAPGSLMGPRMVVVGVEVPLGLGPGWRRVALGRQGQARALSGSWRRPGDTRSLTQLPTLSNNKWPIKSLSRLASDQSAGPR